MTAKLTAEDIDWLERRIQASVSPVAPRAAFVNAARQALLREAAARPSRPRRAGAGYLLAAVAILAVLAVLVRRAAAR
jgi:hypothetical protein